MTFPSLEELLPHLSEHGKVEVDLALARWQYAELAARHEAMSAELVELRAAQIEADR